MFILTNLFLTNLFLTNLFLTNFYIFLTAQTLNIGVGL